VADDGAVELEQLGMVGACVAGGVRHTVQEGVDEIDGGRGVAVAVLHRRGCVPPLDRRGGVNPLNRRRSFEIGTRGADFCCRRRSYGCRRGRPLGAAGDGDVLVTLCPPSPPSRAEKLLVGA